MEEYRISKDFLEEAIDKCSKALVGQAMKRFEVHRDVNEIKKACKELIYEQFRNFETILKSFSSGVKFTSKPRKQE